MLGPAQRTGSRGSWRRWLWPHRCCCAPTGALALPVWRRRSALLGSQAVSGARGPAAAVGRPRGARRARRVVVVLAEPLLERALVFGPAPDTPARASFDGAVGITAGDVIAPAVSSGALLLAAIWAGAALVLPWLIRGRSLNADIVMATAWSAGTAAATIALGEALGARVAQNAPHGLAPGAVAAAALAIALAHARRGTVPLQVAPLSRLRRTVPRGTAAEAPPASELDTQGTVPQPPYLWRMRTGSPR